jgi:hypothetical protein
MAVQRKSFTGKVALVRGGLFSLCEGMARIAQRGVRHNMYFARHDANPSTKGLP